ncbi:SseB family protein [Microbacterium sp. SSW1-49]|uniref:SseB family protein n=1 Tax=Microbacterium croceum TaxID=2851645 RepID=A0ABT0FB93_9MICO|nr:SseB family protein [Microbacterium croceum]
MAESRPASVLERAIAQGREGRLDPETVLWVIAAGQVLLLNEGEPPESDFPDAPLIVDGPRGRLLAVFTHPDQFGRFAPERVPVLVPAFELLRRVPEFAGLVVNPGSPIGLEVPAEGLRAFVTRLLSPLQEVEGVSALSDMNDESREAAVADLADYGRSVLAPRFPGAELKVVPLPEDDAVYVYPDVRGGGILIVARDKTALFAASSIQVDDAIAEFRNGRRSVIHPMPQADPS